MRWAILTMFGVLAGCAPTGPPPLGGQTEVTSCQPCWVLLGTSPDGWRLTFEPGGPGAIRAIVVRRPSDGATQRLPVEDMAPQPGRFRIGAEDLLGDGHPLLLLVTSQGVANSYAQYWRVDPTTGWPVSLGTFPILQPKLGTDRLVAYERNGAGGLFFTRAEYRLVRGRLEVERIEEQVPAGDTPDRARRVVKERQGAELVTVEDRIVAAP